MGMSTYVKGYISKDSEMYKKHSKVLTACIEAGIEKLPEETARFFNSQYPEKYLLDEVLEIDVPCIEKNKDMETIYEIKVSDIDPKTDVIRFINSW